MTVSLTWLGQSGFIVDGDGTTLVVDPFLSPHELRLVEPPRLEALPNRVDAVLVTHGHSDHLDLAGLAEWVESGATLTSIIVPTPHVSAASAALPDIQIVGVQPDERLTIGTADVTVVPACHGIDVSDGYSEGYGLDPAGTPHVGYVVGIASTKMYHAGDTILSPALCRALARFAIDVALLPVNGRDATREAQGILGNLTATEAVDLATQLRVEWLVPCHHDAIRGNTAPVGDVVRAAQDMATSVRVLTPEHGQVVNLDLGGPS